MPMVLAVGRTDLPYVRWMKRGSQRAALTSCPPGHVWRDLRRRSGALQQCRTGVWSLGSPTCQASPVDVDASCLSRLRSPASFVFALQSGRRGRRRGRGPERGGNNWQPVPRRWIPPLLGTLPCAFIIIKYAWVSVHISWILCIKGIKMQSVAKTSKVKRTEGMEWSWKYSLHTRTGTPKSSGRCHPRNLREIPAEISLTMRFVHTGERPWSGLIS